MSTILLIGRCPAARSRSCIHRGDGPTVTLSITVATYRAHSPGSSIATATASDTAGPFSAYAPSGACHCAPVIAATSRAMPSMLIVSARFGHVCTSSTTSPR